METTNIHIIPHSGYEIKKGNVNIMQIYKIADEYEALVAAIESGEIPEEAADDTLESVRAEFEAK